eukprot:NODE_7_length_48057_cov_0.322240.p10 type:complete len:357 gc:universal NODE_7_length_48057_cov_0.322240:27865-28935(+)
MIKTVPTSNSLGVLQLFVKEGGSRNLKPGVSSMLGYFGYSGNENLTQLKIAREAELRGVAFSYTVERDYLAFKAQFLKTELSFVMDVFKNLQNVEYVEYKYKDIKIKAENESWGAFSTKNTFVEEYLHLLSFRGQPLGESIYPKSPVSLSDIKSAASSVFRNSQILGIGFEKSELEKFELSLGKAKPSEIAKFVGGETVIHKPFASTVAIAIPISNSADADALRNSLGDTTPRVKYGNSASLMSRSAPKDVLITTKACHHENSPSLLQFAITANTADQFKASYIAIQEALGNVKESLPVLPNDTANGKLKELINEELGLKLGKGNVVKGAKEALANIKSLKSIVYVGDVNHIPKFQ